MIQAEGGRRGSEQLVRISKKREGKKWELKGEGGRDRLTGDPFATWRRREKWIQGVPSIGHAPRPVFAPTRRLPRRVRGPCFAAFYFTPGSFNYEGWRQTTVTNPRPSSVQRHWLEVHQHDALLKSSSQPGIHLQNLVTAQKLQRACRAPKLSRWRKSSVATPCSSPPRKTSKSIN